MGVDPQLPEWIDKGGDDSDSDAENVIEIAKTVFEVFTEASGAPMAAVTVLGKMGYELFYGTYAKAMADVKRARSMMGYAVGVVAGAIGARWAWVKHTFAYRSAPPGFGEAGAIIARAGVQAYNDGLVTGYKAASELSEEKKKKLRTEILVVH